MMIPEVEVMNSRGQKGDGERDLELTSRFLACAVN